MSHHRPTPALPELPPQPPARLQFNLRQLLAFMLVSALLSVPLRYVVLFVQKLPQHSLVGVQNAILIGLPVGAVSYFLFRLPWLALGLARQRRRWRQICEHRQAWEAWVRRQSDEAGNPPEPEQPPSGE